MKKRLLFGLLLSGLASCKRHEPRVEHEEPTRPTGTMLRKEQVDSGQYAAHDQLLMETFHLEAIQVDSSLFFPLPQHALTLQANLTRAWQRYLRQHPAFKQRFPCQKNSLGYSASFWLLIDQAGRMHESGNSFTSFKRCCYEAISPVLKQAVWSRFYRRTPTGRHYASLQVLVNCYVAADYSLSGRLDGYTPGDNTSGHGFFAWKNNQPLTK